MRTALLTVAAFAVAAVPAFAQTMPAPTAKTFVAKAGASDKFEISEAQLMTGSSNSAIQAFANKMIADHTDSTAKVKAAATSDGLTPMPPKLDAMQASNLAALKAAKGKARDALYVKQQIPAHQKALALMQAEASGGKTTALKQAATDITPVVQSHLDMLNQMQSSM